MAIFGKLDASTFSNNVGVTNADATVTKNAADTINQGDIIELDGVAYFVEQVTSTTAIELHTTYAGSTDTALAGAVRRTAPKAVAEYVLRGGDTAAGELLFIDATEAGLAENKSRGLSGPGWWNYRTYTDYAGGTRHKAECIAALSVAAGTSGDDADDTLVADVASSVTITAQPAASTSSSGAGTFTLSTSTTGTPGALAYVWQRQTASGKRWSNVTASLDTGITYADFTTATLAYSGLAGDTLDGNKFRVKITSAGGTEEVISDGAATVTFGS
ncbi:head protein [Synechococcus phage ACG-2014h]|uniref:Virion structural protein n=1 Tax=Synechococcus phage ACG-2014h TaxID=1340810 RepID=V5USD5_9CAUD|nr:head protein [Synechococcus phage ACG-2014h]AHB80573.1 virion structural protein [Synechococcus phage ACG-2014h]